MSNGDGSLSAAVKAEWDTLRAEIATRDTQNFQITIGSIAAYTALLTLFITFAKETGVQVASGTEHVVRLPVILYFIPFAVMLPSIYLILNNVHATRRIAGYIETYLEPKSDLQWESLLGRFYEKLDTHYKTCESRWDRWGVRPFEEAKAMFAVFFGLGVLDGAVFFQRGDWPAFAGGPATRLLVLAIPFVFFVDAGRRVFSKHCARGHYQNIWKQVHDQQEIERCLEIPKKDVSST